MPWTPGQRRWTAGKTGLDTAKDGLDTARAGLENVSATLESRTHGLDSLSAALDRAKFASTIAADALDSSTIALDTAQIGLENVSATLETREVGENRSFSPQNISSHSLHSIKQPAEVRLPPIFAGADRPPGRAPPVSGHPGGHLPRLGKKHLIDRKMLVHPQDRPPTLLVMF